MHSTQRSGYFRFIVAIILFPGLLGFACLTLASTKDAQQLERMLMNVKTIKANFSQIVQQGQRTVQHSQGTLAALRPAHFRWYSTKPTQQLIIADGHDCWIYDKDLNQVTVKPLNKGMTGTPALFLTGYEQSIGRYYYVKAQQGQRKGEIDFILSPKSKREEMFAYIWLHFKGEQLYYMRFVDRLGQTTETYFSEVHLNIPLRPDLFQFRIPKGADLIHGE